MTESVEIAQRRGRTEKTSDAAFFEEPRYSLGIGCDHGLYSSNFEPCIVPGQEPHAECSEKDD